MLCSIFLVEKDGLHLRYAAAPNLPESYRMATDGGAIGPNGGPCSMAVYRREAVFVADFLSDPNFVNFRSKRKIEVLARMTGAERNPKDWWAERMGFEPTGPLHCRNHRFLARKSRWFPTSLIPEKVKTKWGHETRPGMCG